MLIGLDKLGGPDHLLCLDFWTQVNVWAWALTAFGLKSFEFVFGLGYIPGVGYNVN